MEITPKEAALRLGLLPKEIDRLQMNAVRRAMNYWRALTVEGIRSKGVGRSLWAKKAKSLRPIIKREIVRKDGDGWTGGLRMRGLASLQELGGKTLPHTIKAALAPAVMFEGRKGFVRKLEIKHPGSRIPAMPSAAPMAAKVGARAKENFDAALEAAVAQLGLGGS